MRAIVPVLPMLTITTIAQLLILSRLEESFMNKSPIAPIIKIEHISEIITKTLEAYQGYEFDMEINEGTTLEKRAKCEISITLIAPNNNK